MEQSDGWFFVVYVRVVLLDDSTIWARLEEMRLHRDAVHCAMVHAVVHGSFQWLIQREWVAQEEESHGGA